MSFFNEENNVLDRNTKTIVTTALRSAGVEQETILAALALIEGKKSLRLEPPLSLVTQAEASRLASISRFTFRKLVLAGRIKPVEILPGFRRYRRADVESLWEQV